MAQAIDEPMLRAATADDLPRLLQLEQAVVEAERPYNRDIRAGNPVYYDIPDLIHSERSLLLCAEAGDAIVATGYVQQRDSKVSLAHRSHGYLGFMYVSPPWRGQGLNRRLVAALLDWARERGLSHCYLDVYPDNDAAIRAYRKTGFEPSMLEMKLRLSP